MTETVTRQRATRVTDPYSQEQTELNWDNPDEAAIAECIVAPDSTGESISVGRDQARESLTLLVPHGADIQPEDRVVVRGEVYTVDGFPFDYDFPFSDWQPGQKLTVSREVG
ncbi:MAG: head-tail adaptor protein [Actinobacteria bacterium]|nr:head-tail adaptor protein [Actinomycetota bacterium]